MQTVQALHPGVDPMANHLQTYSALQNLLAFQSLAAYRPDSNAFAQVADTLRSSPLFNEASVGKSKESLNGENLRDLFESTVKSTMSAGAGNNGEGKNNGDNLAANATTTEKGSLRDDAAQLIPMLYEEYRRRVIEDIRAEEQKYNHLINDIKSLEVEKSTTHQPEHGHERLQNIPAMANGHATSEQDPPPPSEPSPTEISKGKQSLESKIDASEKPTLQEKAHPRRANASLDLIINHDEPSEEKRARPSTSGSGATSTFSQHDSHRPPSVTQNASQPSFAGSPRMGRDSRGTIDARTMPSPRSNQPLSQVSPHSPTTPVILPPPPGMNPPPFPPTSPYAQHADHSNYSAYHGSGPLSNTNLYSNHDPYAAARYHDQYTPHAYSQRDPHRSNSLSQPQVRQSYPGYQSQPLAYSSAPHHQQQSHRGGVILPPFQVSPRVPSSAQFSHPTPVSVPQSTVATPPRKARDRVSAQAENSNTPTRTPSSARRPTPLTVPHTAYLRDSLASASPGSSTVWRNIPSAHIRERSPPRSISPTSEGESTPAPPRGSVGPRGRRGKAVKAPEQEQAVATAHTPRDRPQSQSPQVSESVSASRLGRLSRRMKQEPPGTPTASAASNEVDVATATDSTIRASSKRKRVGSSVDNVVTTNAGPVSPVNVPSPDTVIAYRNFGKMAQPVMNVISSHKHASLFAEPVRERQAEGYRDIIKRPQDLKSIRAAIAAGSRAVAAAFDVQQASPGAASGSASGNAIVLPVNESLVPPKGIVNAAQLELEIMRMFANAVMFNPGDDEIVQDSREMYESVEQALQQWRDVERMEEIEDTPRDEDEASTVSSTKRRRL